MLEMKRGEIWWVDFEPSIGGEIRKVRPAIIVSNDISNRYINRVQVIPVTSNISRVYPGETLVFINQKQGKAMANQLTTVSKQRLKRRIGKVTDAEMKQIEEIIRLQLGLRN